VRENDKERYKMHMKKWLYWTNFTLVGNFMEKFGQKVIDKKAPDLGNKELQDLRVSLIQEEVKELQEALAEKDIIEVADALTDILYVTYGAGHAFGIDLDDCFEEVHRSNMSKLGEDDNPIYREDGKVMKGPLYFTPNLQKVIYGNSD
jgi:predicted HAD superfamily Cof-like phosphohydrolase